MSNITHVRVARWLLLVVATFAARPAFAQVDLSGQWATTFDEDYWHRQDGPAIGDYTGLPINEAGRYKAESWMESVQAEHERQCIPHVATYYWRGPDNFRISNVTDEAGRVIAIDIYPLHHSLQRIWLDGRPHPPEYAKHTWSGFSTGTWNGNILTVKTSHIKWGWIQRNGVPVSDLATTTEYIIKHDTYLTVVVIVEDPVYLSEPFIRSSDFEPAPNQRGNQGVYPCGPDQIADEVSGWSKGFVPHYLPGTNDQIEEFSTTNNLPPVGALGGAETMYPEFLQKLKVFGDTAASKAKATSVRGNASEPFIGNWALNRGKSTFGAKVPQPLIRTMEFESVGNDGYRVVTSEKMGLRTGLDRIQYVAKFDGKDYPVTGPTAALESVVLKRIDARTLEQSGKRSGKVVETTKASVSADGAVLTLTTDASVEGQTVTSVQVFERQ